MRAIAYFARDTPVSQSATPSKPLPHAISPIIFYRLNSHFHFLSVDIRPQDEHEKQPFRIAYGSAIVPMDAGTISCRSPEREKIFLAAFQRSRVGAPPSFTDARSCRPRFTHVDSQERDHFTS